MGSLLKFLFSLRIFQVLTRPITRFLVGLIAIPIFRLLFRNVFKNREIDKEFERDIEQWFRGSILLLFVTANMEHLIFEPFQSKLQDPHAWFWVGLRLLLAVGVVDAMPDQDLFSVIHPGPPLIKPQKGFFREVWRKRKVILRGLVCQHMSRSSPVLAIIAVLFGGRYEDNPEAWLAGWICYGIAITQYLIIGLVTSRDKAFDVLAEFDKAVARRRRELLEEFEIPGDAGNGESQPAPPDGGDPAADDSSAQSTIAESDDVEVAKPG